MTTTLDAIVRRCCDLLGPDAFGISVPITALAAQSATAAVLATGGLSDGLYAQKWMWRPGTTNNADRRRCSTAWTQTTGLVTHAGAAYADTTVGTETLMLLLHDPIWIRRLVNEIVQRINEYDETIIPLVHGQREYWLHGHSWITEPADIQELWYTHSPIITKNVDFQKRHVVSTAGILQPDDWTVTSNGDSTPWTPANYRGQRYYYNLERASGVDATLGQAIHTLRTGNDGDPPSGQVITAFVICDPATAGDVLLTLTDGTSTVTSTGTGAAFQTISTSLTLAENATVITVTITAQTNNAAQPIYRAGVLIGPLDDAVERDDYERYPIPRDYVTFQQGGPLKIRLPDSFGFPGQLIVGSNRPYPAFDATRLGSGAADTDETDADEVTVATGVIYKIYEAKAAGDTKSPDWDRAAEWKKRFESLVNRHLYVKTPRFGGFNAFNSPLMTAPRGPN